MKPTWVIKVGGALLSAPKQAKALMQGLKQLSESHQLVLVHGGGELVADWLKQLGLETNKHKGLRITPQEHLPFVVGALAGAANKQICATALANDIEAVGLSLMDGRLCHCSQQDPQLGAVGSAKPNQAKLLVSLLQQGYLPVISSIGADASGQLFNVNADQAAISICQLLGAELLLLSDVEGVLDGQKQLIPELYPKQIKQLIQQQVIKDGMLVKVGAAHSAALSIQKPVTIASWKQPHCLLALSEGRTFGTKVFPMEL